MSQYFMDLLICIRNVITLPCIENLPNVGKRLVHAMDYGFGPSVEQSLFGFYYDFTFSRTLIFFFLVFFF